MKQCYATPGYFAWGLGLSKRMALLPTMDNLYPSNRRCRKMGQSWTFNGSSKTQYLSMLSTAEEHASFFLKCYCKQLLPQSKHRSINGWTAHGSILFATSHVALPGRVCIKRGCDVFLQQLAPPPGYYFYQSWPNYYDGTI